MNYVVVGSKPTQPRNDLGELVTRWFLERFRAEVYNRRLHEDSEVNPARG